MAKKAEGGGSEGAGTFRLKNGAVLSIAKDDAIHLLKRKEGSADVVVTSPPYNIGKRYGEHMDNMPRWQYMEWMAEFGKAAARSLKSGGSLFLNVGGRPEDPWLPWDVARAISGSMRLQNVIHWIKSITLEGEGPDGSEQQITAGHFKPIVSKRYLNDCHEYIFHFTHRGEAELDKLAIGVPYKDKSNIGRWKSAGRDLRDRGNTWFIPYETIRSRTQRPHPATFPSKLPEMCIRLHGVRPDMLVIDPFMGIGSSAIACAALSVSFAGCDIDAAYVSESRQRVRRYLDSNPELLS